MTTTTIAAAGPIDEPVGRIYQIFHQGFGWSDGASKQMRTNFDSFATRTNAK